MSLQRRALTQLFVLILSPVVLAFSQSGPPSQSTQHLEITLEWKKDGKWLPSDPGRIFDQQDLVRFRVKSDFEGHLYVMNHGTSGDYTLLFPREDTGKMNKIMAAQEYLIPAEEGAFQITGPAGHEIVYWLMSPVELSQEAAGAKSTYVPLSPPPKGAKAAATLIPRCDDTIFRARGDCVDSSAGPKEVPAAEILPENLARVQVSDSRELSFIKKENSTLVSSPQSLHGPVIFEFRLAHR